VLISADALWENGFGIVFPELEGDPAFHEVESVLDLIGTLGARWVIPGHGAPFSDVAGALQRARSRLSGFRADPARHMRHGAKVLVKYHLMEDQQQALPALRAWMADAPFLTAIWDGLGRPEGSLAAWNEHLLRDMLAAGTLVLRDGVVHDR
jgi:glyoxylase-like metal-dependent hydrolase (beta-lactamase superfamily II)